MNWTPITDDELLMLTLSGELHTRCAWLWRDVSMTQLSIARHSRVAVVEGEHYTYLPTDELVRNDVLKAVKKLRKPHAALDRLVQTQEQLGLYE